MASIPIPFVNRSLSTDSPTSAVITFVMVVFGFAALYLAQDLGQSTKRTVSQTLGVGSDASQDRENALFVI